MPHEVAKPLCVHKTIVMQAFVKYYSNQKSNRRHRFTNTKILFQNTVKKNGLLSGVGRNLLLDGF